MSSEIKRERIYSQIIKAEREGKPVMPLIDRLKAINDKKKVSRKPRTETSSGDEIGHPMDFAWEDAFNGEF